MNRFKFFAFVFVVVASPVIAHADGQGPPIHYDSLSYFEEPMAVGIGPATVNANMLVDQAVLYDSKYENDRFNTRVNGDVTIETELPNSVQLGARYSARYDRLANRGDRQDETYRDDVAVFVSDEWGTLAGGNVTGSVHENTRRKRGFGNANLANDDFIGELDEAGAYYAVRYNSYIVSMTADQEGRAEAGLTFQRPIRKANYLASARIRKGDAVENSDINARGKSYGGAVVGQYTYASFLIDTQIGYETIKNDQRDDHNDHVFGSVGMQYKYGAYRGSIEGSLGRFDGENRSAVAVGGRMDLARGASLNLGVNYERDEKDTDIDDERTTALASVRYEF